MNKIDAQKRLTAIETAQESIKQETAELRKIIEAPEPATSLLTKPMPRSGKEYWSITFINGGVCANTAFAGFATDYIDKGNMFQSKALGEAYADAVNTMLLLRHQPGTVSNKYEHQFVICIAGSGTSIEILSYDDFTCIASRISPAFKYEADAKKAIEAVGSDRILRMFKTFHHVA